MKKILLSLFIGLFVITGCGKKEEKEVKEELKMNTFVSSNIEVDSFLSKDNKLIIQVENISSEMIDLLDIDVAFYNEKEELLKTSEAFLKNILSEKEGYVSLELPKDENGTVIESSKIDIKVHENKYSTQVAESYLDHIKVTYTKDKNDENKVNLKISNTSNKTLNEVEIVTLLKENGSVVATLSTYLINLGKEATSTIYIPSVTKDNTTNYVTYDEIEFHVNHAIMNK